MPSKYLSVRVPPSLRPSLRPSLCLRRITTSLLICCSGPLLNISLQAESIASPEAYLSYLEAKHSRASQAHLVVNQRCKVSTSTIPKILPGHVKILTGVLTLFPASAPGHTSSGDTSFIRDQTALSVRRILQLHGGLSSSHPSVQIALSCLVHLRLKFSLASQGERSPALPRVSFCGLLSIPPEISSHFDELEYLNECRRTFSPLSVTPVFPLGKESQMWEHLNRILAQVQAIETSTSISLSTLVSSPLSYQLLSLQSSSVDLERLHDIVTRHSSSVLVLPSIPLPVPALNLSGLFLELSIGSLSGPLVIISSKEEVTQLHLMSNPCSLYPQQSCSLSPSLRYALERVGYRMVSSTRLTKRAVNKLLKSMESFLEALMGAIRLSAVAWREMNLLNSLSARAGAGGASVPILTREEGTRIQLGPKLFTDNQRLFEDLLHRHHVCDQAMVSLLYSLREFLRS
jgi:hypothetical protein